jgi:hypothetical protein
MSLPLSINFPTIEVTTGNLVFLGEIDSLQHLANRRIFFFSGEKDSVVV